MDRPHKLLRPYPDVPIVRRSAGAALAAATGPVAIVVDPALPDVAAAVADLPLTVLANTDAAAGASTSVRRAAEWAFEGGLADALILTLGDEPDLDPALVAALLARWRARPVPGMRVRYTDRPGHPVLITRALLDGHQPVGDSGLGEALAGLHAHDLVVDQEAPLDIDSEDDYRAALARLAH